MRASLQIQLGKFPCQIVGWARDIAYFTTALLILLQLQGTKEKEQELKRFANEIEFETMTSKLLMYKQ